MNLKFETKGTKKWLQCPYCLEVDTWLFLVSKVSEKNIRKLSPKMEMTVDFACSNCGAEWAITFKPIKKDLIKYGKGKKEMIVSSLINDLHDRVSNRCKITEVAEQGVSSAPLLKRGKNVK